LWARAVVTPDKEKPDYMATGGIALGAQKTDALAFTRNQPATVDVLVVAGGGAHWSAISKLPFHIR
jgi:hypothetical protein